MIQLYARLADLTPTEAKTIKGSHYTDYLEDIRQNGIKLALQIHPNGLIGNGNFRYWCAKELKMEYVPVDLWFFCGLEANAHLCSLRSDLPIPRNIYVDKSVIVQKHTPVPLLDGTTPYPYRYITNLRWLNNVQKSQ